ncbi:uncharacterized protein B0T15DRAFT_536665 [Chaetomium strumarium]|uniref:Transmembrane protein n=1 Tax=Chaetomium strumarium TaxID=1170767 RepID=A0AAJ0M0I1_9PEZI|nr:hypothetical protein B0T15DRAFT_536665 [Chaetomium strumarium]
MIDGGPGDDSVHQFPPFFLDSSILYLRRPVLLSSLSIFSFSFLHVLIYFIRSVIQICVCVRRGVCCCYGLLNATTYLYYEGGLVGDRAFDMVGP